MNIRSRYTVVGMNCGHCVESISSGLAGVPGVTGVEVDLGSGLVILHSERPLAADAVRGAVDAAGFALAGSGASPTGGGAALAGGTTVGDE
jgi:copper chaperone CopZ